MKRKPETPKILTLDIETNQHKGRFWSLFKPMIGPDRLDEPTRMLCWAAKWHGQKHVEARIDTDPDCLPKLIEMINEADAVITYNGDKFDLPHINREALLAGFPPLRPVTSIDLYKVVKRTFKLPSNRLDYVCFVLFGEHKMSTGGIELWDDFENGDPKAIAKMLRYNKRDVTLTERVFDVLRPWIKNHPYLGPSRVYVEDAHQDYECEVCGNTDMVKQRPRRTRCFAIRVLSCPSCGHWQDGKRKKIN